jgi:hypothetical protein
MPARSLPAKERPRAPASPASTRLPPRRGETT